MLTRSRTIVVIAVVAAAFGLTACSDDSNPGGPSGDAEQILDDALAAHAAGELDRAVDLYEQVLVLDPQNRFAYYNLGLIDQTRGDVAAAAAASTSRPSPSRRTSRRRSSTSRSSAPSRVRPTRRSACTGT